MNEKSSGVTGASIKAPPLVRMFVRLGGILSALVLVMFAFDKNMAVSALLGGMTFVVPQGYLAYRMFAHRGARQARKIVDSFYRGVTGKFILSGLMVALTLLAYREMNMAPYAIAYVLMWFANTVLMAAMVGRE